MDRHRVGTKNPGHYREVSVSRGSNVFDDQFYNCSLTALMMTDVGVLTLNENPSFLAPFTKAPSSENKAK